MVRGTLRVPRYPRLVVVQKTLGVFCDDERRSVTRIAVEQPIWMVGDGAYDLLE